VERFAGRYALVRPLGHGGMGRVWLALDLTDHSECALKQLDLRFPRRERDSLRREFEVLARVRHPAVVAVRELGFAPDGTPYFTMEVVPGQAADLALGQGEWAAYFSVASRLTAGLEALHRAGIVHGDVKPSNLLVLTGSAPGEPPVSVRLLDFGLAGLLDRERKGHRGTAGYTAPEVVSGGPASVASDLHSLGATLFVLAMVVARGTAPGRAQPVRPPRDAAAAALALEEAAVPGVLTQLVLSLLAPVPTSRPANAGEVRAELARMHPAADQPLSERTRAGALVGRSQEMARIERWWALAPRGTPLQLLAGPLGAGRTLLLRELAVRASLAGRTVVSVSCLSGSRPGEIARTLLLRLLAAGDPDTAVRKRLECGDPLDAAELAALAESAIRWRRAISSQSSSPGDVAAAPLLLLDDVEQIDPLSLAFVLRMISSEEGGVFRWVWACSTEFANAVDGGGTLRQAGLAEELVLGPLDRALSDQLVATRIQFNPPSELLEAIWLRCGGHPGWTVEALRVATLAGVLREHGNAITLDREALECVSWPAGPEDALRRRLADLEPVALATAAALAVWGAPARTDDLRELEPSADVHALRALEAAGLLAHTQDGSVALNPPALADLVRSALPEDARARLHRVALTRPRLAPSQAFRHHLAAGNIESALDAASRALEHSADPGLAAAAAAAAVGQAPEVTAGWEERAGQLFVARGRYRVAMPHFERAVALTPGGVARARRQFALSSTYLRIGATDRLEELLRSALAAKPPAREHALLLVNRSACQTRLGDNIAALETGEEAHRLALESGDDESVGLSLIGLATLALKQPEGAERAQDLARRASAAFARVGHDAGRLRAENLLAHALWAAQRHDEAERVMHAALGEASRLDLRLATHELSRGLALVLVARGQWSEARAFEEEALRLAIEEGWPGVVGEGLTTLAILDALMGHTARALRRARAALPLIHQHHRFLEPTALRALAMARRMGGHTRLAARALRASHRALALESGLLEVHWLGVEHGKLLARAGRWREAERVWRGAYAEPGRVDSVGTAILALLIARAELRNGTEAAAERGLAEVRAWLADHAAGYARAHADQVQAELALVRAEVEAGALAVRAALEAFNALPAPADAAAAALEFARLAWKHNLGARVPLAPWLEQAATGFEQVGDRASRERSLALAVDWYRSVGPKPIVGRNRDLLHSVSRLLDSLPDFRQLTREAMRLAVDQLDAERGVLLIAEGENGDLKPEVEHGAIDAATRDRAVTFSRAVVRRVAESGGSVMIEDAASDPEELSNSVVELGLRSVLCVPMFSGEKLVGAVYLDDSRRPDMFHTEELRLLEGFAGLLGTAILSSREQADVRATNERLAGENRTLRREASARGKRVALVGGSRAMRGVLELIERAASTRATVLVTGEPGTGKELVARMIHRSGPRSAQPFIAVNCGAIGKGVLESELFGHRKGSFTSATETRAGRFELAHRGTLFLDEIGEMPLDQQVALLRVLTEGAVTPVGGGRPIPVDVRIIAASNRDLSRRTAEGQFREDLWYRLNVFPITLPPLRERRADIPALAQHFVSQFAEQMGRELPTLSPGLTAALMRSDWPGNVRELQNYIERLMAMTRGDVLHPDPLPDDLQKRALDGRRIDAGGSLRRMVEALEKREVLQALDRNQGNQVRAAKELGLTEQSLRYRLRKYGQPVARQIRRTR